MALRTTLNLKFLLDKLELFCQLQIKKLIQPNSGFLTKFKLKRFLSQTEAYRPTLNRKISSVKLGTIDQLQIEKFKQISIKQIHKIL